MKVILQQNVKGLGGPGQVVEVAPGYARNYLIPKGLAIEATKTNLEKLKSKEQAQEKQRERELAEAQKIAADLANITLVIPAKAGESGRLFGSITAADIAGAIRTKTGHDVDRRKIVLPEPLRQLGSTQVEVRLHPQVTVTITVEVVQQQ